MEATEAEFLAKLQEDRIAALNAWIKQLLPGAPPGIDHIDVVFTFDDGHQIVGNFTLTLPHPNAG